MTLLKLLEGLNVKKTVGPLTVEIKEIAYDSRSVKKGFLFVAIRGYSVDGHDFIEDAISRGAAAIITERAVDSLIAQGITDRNTTAFIEVDASREALALLSSRFYGHPSERMVLVGITGTNGKTTTSFITKSILEAGGKRTGLLGTISYITGDKTIMALNTTPESLELQRYLKDMLDNGMNHAVMEISSHALMLKRVEDCSFKVTAFTNLTRDHLDFHGTMDEYLDAKNRIFNYLSPEGTAVLNRDDPAIKALAGELDCNVITCGIGEGAMIRAVNISERRIKNADNRQQTTEHRTSSLPGLSFRVQTPTDEFSISTKLVGRFNVYNILISIGIAYALGIDTGAIQSGIRDAGPVEGRFESVEAGQDFLCIVDYAHTDDALEKLIEEARHIARGRIITVFGCGGDRDRTKRPLMGKIASELSDLVIITSDNPRNEDPEQIIRDIIPGIKKKNYSICPDRAEAIAEAVSIAESDDIVLVAGKGHEDYQEIMGRRHSFSDRDVLIKAIRKVIN